AAESLGYDPARLSVEERSAILGSLNDRSQSIFVAAKHISDLRNADYPGRRGSELDKSAIVTIGARYNQGPDIPLDRLNNELSYGKTIARRWAQMTSLLSPDAQRRSVEYKPIERGIVTPIENYLFRMYVSACQLIAN